MTSGEPYLSRCEYIKINDRFILCCAPESELDHLHHRLDWYHQPRAILFRPSPSMRNLDLSPILQLPHSPLLQK